MTQNEVSSPASLIATAVRLRDRGNIGGALTLFRQVDLGVFATVRADLARTYIIAGEEQLARAVLVEGAGDAAHQPNALEYCILCRDVGLYDEEQRILEALIAAEPDNLEALYRLAYLLARKRYDVEAIAILDRLTAIGYHGGDGAFALAILYLAREQWQAAAAHFAVAYGQQAGSAADPGVRDAYAQSHANPNRFAAFEMVYAAFRDDYFPLLVGVKFTAAEARSYDISITRAWNSLRSREAAAALIARDRAANGRSATNCCLSAHEAWLGGDRLLADREYQAAKALYHLHGVIPFHSNCGSMVWLPENDLFAAILTGSARSEEGGAEFFWPARPTGKNPITFLVACDAGYFSFFPSFLESIIHLQNEFEGARQLHVHCHVVDATDEQVALLRQLQEASRRVSVSFSLAKAAHRERAYYTCLRYIVAHSVIEHMQCPTFIMDIDLRVTANFPAVVRDLADYDIGLRMDGFPGQGTRQIRGEPWTINAQSMYISGKAPGIEFLRIIQEYIAAAYDPANLSNWTVDQCAIAQAFSWLNSYVPNLRTKNLTFAPALFDTSQSYPTKDAFLRANPITYEGILALAAGAEDGRAAS
ncbi:tetratricopeptide repeat protein [Sphingomonas profundi]|uniref:tetratricopeptide repeat protein n=1 Tax=Alterirhizorhabdus profundi TaxID=2681549 RepID=UPI0012E82E5B|nr:tetratricopeptide repeat protein [Sphingomonas profundi]